MIAEKCKTKVDIGTGKLSGDGVLSSKRTLSDVSYLFYDKDALGRADLSAVVYSVESHEAVPAGTPGGLFFGTSTVKPGRVGDEYYMTKGHFHSRRETAEYYWGISGSGVLVLMGEDGACRIEEVRRGTLHYIPGRVAHRLVNTGEDDLVVGACWPSDAGHDYGSIEDDGFPVRIVCRDGKPTAEEVKR